MSARPPFVSLVSAVMLVLRLPVQYSFALRIRFIEGEGYHVARMLMAMGGFALLMLVSATASSAVSTAYFKIGDDLKASCDGTAAGEPNASTAEYLLCLGYLQGVVDTDATLAEWGETPRQACIPRGVTSSRLRQVFLQWLNEHPDQLRFSAASLALAAFSESWPCK